ncbi:MAG: superoxide dismutase [Candidatus Aureabacteria bacterium]|nr:superoxide dismutase [Candidatus Auribacterota bacterium]
MKKPFIFTGWLLGTLFLFTLTAHSHCQIPCGIYNDEARFAMLNEHVATIEKSINEILRLSSEDQKNFNQIVRWIDNKDEHANKITDIACDYFLAQRLPLEPEKDGSYSKKLTLLHQMIVYSMKLKQTTDLDFVKKIKQTIADFHDAYFIKDE